MTESLFFADPRTETLYVEPKPIGDVVNAFQRSAFQFNAFQIRLGSEHTFIFADPRTEILYAERREP